MSRKDFNIIEEDGVIIYDESDDYDPGENDIEHSQCGEFHLMTNEEIFTDEYMQEYAERMNAKIRRERRVQRLISIGVIIGVSLYIALLSYIYFRRIIC